jgi:aminomethyltransferase
LLGDKAKGVPWNLVGLEVDWPSLEREFGRVELVPQVTGRASRAAIPVYHHRRQIGQATSHTFSPVLKKYIAIASLETGFAVLGNDIDIEITVEYERRRAKARVVKLPFFNPSRKKE